MSSPGVAELLIVLVIVLVLLGPKRLPALGRQLGGGIREFKNSITRSGDRGNRADDDASPGIGRPEGSGPDRAEPQAVEGEVVRGRRSS